MFLIPFPWRGHATLLTTAGKEDSGRTVQDASDPDAPDQAAYLRRFGAKKKEMSIAQMMASYTTDVIALEKVQNVVNCTVAIH